MKTRNQRGEATISILIGAAIGSVVLFGAMNFAGAAMTGAGANATSAQTEAQVTEASNRIRRDIQRAEHVTVTPRSVEVSYKLASGTPVQVTYKHASTNLIAIRTQGGVETIDTLLRDGIDANDGFAGFDQYGEPVAEGARLVRYEIGHLASSAAVRTGLTGVTE